MRVSKGDGFTRSFRDATFVTVAALIVAAMLAGCGGSDRSAKPPAATTVSFETQVARVKSGVIRIEARTCDGTAIGTGVLIKPTLVATVEHVVDGATKITLKRNGVVLGTASVIGADTARDLALLKTRKPIKGFTFGFATGSPKLGEEVGALGFPLGLPLTVTRGSVSGFGRTIPIGGVKRRHLVQTDAAVNQGNSGGPLISIASGNIVGLVDLGTTEANGIAFAVSSDVAAPLLKAWAAGPQSPPTNACGSSGTSAGNAGTGSPADYADAVDTALIDSARTRGDLGDLINGVNTGSYDYATAVNAIEAITSQRRTLLAAVQAVDAPAPFARSADLLKASLVASLADDLAVEEWIKATLEGDAGAANAAWAQNVQASSRASAAKSRFLKTYNAVRQRLLGLSPLDVAY